MKFCTVSDVLPIMNNVDGFTGDNNLIAVYIQQVTEMIKQYTRREWLEDVYTDVLSTSDIDTAIRRGNGFYAATLREKPVNVTDPLYPVVRYNTGGKFSDTDPLDRSIYSIDVRKNQIILYPGVMTYNARSLQVVYTAGYPYDDEDTELVLVPQNIRAACAVQVAFYVKRAINNVSGTNRKDSGERLASYGVSKTSGFIAEATALLRTEVRLLVGGNA